MRAPSDPTGAIGRNAGIVESDCGAIVRALADEDALRVFAQVIALTGTGLPEAQVARSAFTMSPPMVWRVKPGCRSASLSAPVGG